MSLCYSGTCRGASADLSLCDRSGDGGKENRAREGQEAMFRDGIG